MDLLPSMLGTGTLLLIALGEAGCVLAGLSGCWRLGCCGCDLLQAAKATVNTRTRVQRSKKRDFMLQNIVMGIPPVRRRLDDLLRGVGSSNRCTLGRSAAALDFFS